MEDKPTDKVVSTQKQLQTSHDPGWNDPPKWAYKPNPISSGSTPTKRLLNKRVAFPLNSTSSSSTNQQLTSLTNLPPPPSSTSSPSIQLTALTTAPHAPMLAPSSTIATENLTCDLIVDNEQRLNDTMENFNSVIDKVLKCDSKIDDIKKRMDIMKEMWLDNKFNNEIHEKLLEISQALYSSDVDTADKIHVTLMINYGSVCNAWIPAIRHLILTMKENKNIENTADIIDKLQPILITNPTDSE